MGEVSNNLLTTGSSSIPVEKSPLDNVLVQLFGQINTLPLLDDDLTKEFNLLGIKLDNRIKRVDALIFSQNTCEAELKKQETEIEEQKNILSHNNKVIPEELREIEELEAQFNHLQVALGNQSSVLETLHSDFANLSEAQAQEKMFELILNMEKDNLDDVDGSRSLALVSSLIFLIGNVCLLPVAPSLCAAGIGASLPGYQYARTAPSVGAKRFTIAKFVRHVVVGGVTHLAVSRLAGPLLVKIGKAFGGAANGCAAIGVNKALDITTEVVGKAVSQAILNTCGILIRKSLLEEEIKTEDIVYALAAGSCGAVASFGIDHYANHINDVVGRIFTKGIAGFVNQASAVCVTNLCQGRDWHMGVFASGIEGFFWSAVYQAADEVRQKQFNQSLLTQVKNEVVDEINKLYLSHETKKALTAAVNNADTVKDIVTILEGCKRDILIEEIAKKDIPAEQKETLIRNLKNKDLGIIPILRNVYSNVFNATDLPQEIKDKIHVAVLNTETPEQIAKALDELRNAMHKDINLARMQGKNWEVAKTTVVKWIRELLKDGYHPTGSHLDPKAYLSCPFPIIEDMAVRILNGQEIIWTHHHRLARIRVNDTKLEKIKYLEHEANQIQPSHIIAEKGLALKPVKPSSIKELTKSLSKFRQTRDLCNKVVAEFAEATKTNKGLDEVQRPLKKRAYDILTPEKKREILKELINKIKEEQSKGPKVLNAFRDPLIPINPESNGLTEHNRKDISKPKLQIRAPKYTAKPNTPLQMMRGVTSIKAPTIPPLPNSDTAYRLKGEQVETLPMTPLLVEDHSFKLKSNPPLMRPLKALKKPSVTKKELLIQRLKKQIKQCGKGKTGRAKRQSLALQLAIHQNEYS